MNFSNLGTLLGGLAQGYGMWQQGKMANKLYKLQLREYNDEKDRKKIGQARLDLAASRSPWLHKYDGAGVPAVA